MVGVFRRVGHPGRKRVEVDVGQRGQKLRFVGHPVALESSSPHGADFVIQAVDLLADLLLELFHEVGNRHQPFAQLVHPPWSDLCEAQGLIHVFVGNVNSPPVAIPRRMQPQPAPHHLPVGPLAGGGGIDFQQQMQVVVHQRKARHAHRGVGGHAFQLTQQNAFAFGSLLVGAAKKMQPPRTPRGDVVRAALGQTDEIASIDTCHDEIIASFWGPGPSDTFESPSANGDSSLSAVDSDSSDEHPAVSVLRSKLEHEIEYLEKVIEVEAEGAAIRNKERRIRASKKRRIGVSAAGLKADRERAKSRNRIRSNDIRKTKNYVAQRKKFLRSAEKIAPLLLDFIPLENRISERPEAYYKTIYPSGLQVDPRPLNDYVLGKFRDDTRIDHIAFNVQHWSHLIHAHINESELFSPKSILSEETVEATKRIGDLAVVVTKGKDIDSIESFLTNNIFIDFEEKLTKGPDRHTGRRVKIKPKDSLFNPFRTKDPVFLIAVETQTTGPANEIVGEMDPKEIRHFLNAKSRNPDAEFYTLFRARVGRAVTNKVLSRERFSEGGATSMETLHLNRIVTYNINERCQIVDWEPVGVFSGLCSGFPAGQKP